MTPGAFAIAPVRVVVVPATVRSNPPVVPNWIPNAEVRFASPTNPPPSRMTALAGAPKSEARFTNPEITVTAPMKSFAPERVRSELLAPGASAVLPWALMVKPPVPVIAQVQTGLRSVAVPRPERSTVVPPLISRMPPARWTTPASSSRMLGVATVPSIVTVFRVMPSSPAENTTESPFTKSPGSAWPSDCRFQLGVAVSQVPPASPEPNSMPLMSQ